MKKTKGVFTARSSLGDISALQPGVLASWLKALTGGLLSELV